MLSIDVRDMSEEFLDYDKVVLKEEIYISKNVDKNWIWDDLADKDHIHAAAAANDEEHEKRKSTKHVLFMEKNLVTGQILDLGCGYGRFWKYLEIKNSQYIGIDGSINMLQIFNNLKNKFESKPSPILIHSKINDLPILDISICNSISAAVILHNPKNDVRDIIDEIYRITVSGGKAIMVSSFPNKFTLTGLQGIMYLTYLKIIGKSNTNGPLRYYSKKEVVSLFSRFSDVKIYKSGCGILPKSVLIFPRFLNNIWRIYIANPINKFLHFIFGNRIPIHFDVVATK